MNDGSWAELYWYAANSDNHEIGGRCLRLGYDDTVSPIRHYHWGVYGTDAKDFAAREFWASEMWTTKRYSSALIGGGPCPNLTVADVDDLWAMLTVGAPPVRVLPARVGPAGRDRLREVLGGIVGGIRSQIIQGVTGLPVNTVEGMSWRLCELLADPEYASHMGELGRQHIRRNFLLPHSLKNRPPVYLALDNPDRHMAGLG